MQRIEYCLHCKKVRKPDTNEWLKTSSSVEMLIAGGLNLDPTYCDGCGSILDGINKENQLRNNVELSYQEHKEDQIRK